MNNRPQTKWRAFL